MLTLSPALGGADRVLCLGAHSDDIELGCAGTLLRLAEGDRPLDVTWVVFGASGVRAREAHESARTVLAGAKSAAVEIHDFRDGFFPGQGTGIKEQFEALKRRVTPDLIFTHYRQDLHQDHRVIADLTWNTFRDHLILEYEIPKYDGDFGSPNVFVALDEALCRKKIEILLRHFASQRDRRWFSEDLFRAVLRLRGMEANAPDGYAEAFYGRKLLVL
jgi:LmbE family N-acetylglucosaminyl deacetylase